MKNFEEIYTLYFQDVYRYVFSLCRDPAAAEEITQETFYQAMGTIQDFRGDCKMTVWLCQIAKHLFFAQEKRRKRPPIGNNIPAPPSALEQQFIDKEKAMYLHRHLHNLKEPYKEVFMLRVFGELSFHKIADIFGKTESWARVTYHRARLKLIKEMEDMS